MKKVLFIIPSLDIGGTENICKILFEEFLFRKKYDVDLFVLNKKRNNNFYYELSKEYRKKIIFSNSYNWLKIFIKLINFTAGKNYASILAFNNETGFVINIMKIFFIRKFKTVLRVNNSIKKKLKYSNNFYDTCFKKFYNYFSLNLSDTIIAQSNEMKNEISEYLINKEKIEVINNPLSKNFKENVCFKKKEKYLLFVGSLTPKKNPLMLLEIYKQFNKNKSPNIKLKIIGDGSELEIMQNFIFLNNLEKNVEIIKAIPQVELQKYYSKALCLIICSKYEGFPNVAIESLFCGTPLLASKCIGGIKELIQDDINGISFEEYTIDSYLKGLNKLLNYDFNYIKIKETSKRFRVDKIIPKYEKLL